MFGEPMTTQRAYWPCCRRGAGLGDRVPATSSAGDGEASSGTLCSVPDVPALQFPRLRSDVCGTAEPADDSASEPQDASGTR
eukprot:7168748-Prymnesium_polylepis.1